VAPPRASHITTLALGSATPLTEEKVEGIGVPMGTRRSMLGLVRAAPAGARSAASRAAIKVSTISCRVSARARAQAMPASSLAAAAESAE
jgi:hypothetical protein